MTRVQLQPDNESPDGWDAQYRGLKARFPGLKDSIVFSIHVLQSNPEIGLDDLKAQAKLHGLRVTASSVKAAQRLLGGVGATKGPATSPTQKTEAGTKPRSRRRRAVQAPLDVEALIRTTAAKIQEEGAAEAERLKKAMRKAIAVLEAASG